VKKVHSREPREKAGLSAFVLLHFGKEKEMEQKKEEGKDPKVESDVLPDIRKRVFEGAKAHPITVKDFFESMQGE